MKEHILGLPEDHEPGTGASEDGLQMFRKYKTYGDEIFKILKYFISELLPIMVYRPIDCVNYVLEYLQQNIYVETVVSGMTNQISALGMGDFAEDKNDEVEGAAEASVAAGAASVAEAAGAGEASVTASAAEAASVVASAVTKAAGAVHADEASAAGAASAASLYSKTVGTFGSGSFELLPSLFDGADQYNTFEVFATNKTNKVKRTILDTPTKKPKKQKYRGPILCDKCGRTKLGCRGYLKGLKIRRLCEAMLPSGEIVLKPYTGKVISYNCSEQNFEITFSDLTNPFGNFSLVDLNLYHIAYCDYKKQNYIELTLP